MSSNAEFTVGVLMTVWLLLLVPVMVWYCWNLWPVPIQRWWAIGFGGASLAWAAAHWRAELWKKRYHELEAKCVIRETGEAFADYMDKNFRDLPCIRIEMDEQWQYVGCHAGRLPKGDKTERGDYWLWACIDADTKLVISLRQYESAPTP